MKLGNYKNYDLGVRVRIIDSNLEGEAFESVGDCISVFIDGDKKCSYFHKDNVEFIKQTK